MEPESGPDPQKIAEPHRLARNAAFKKAGADRMAVKQAV